MHTHTHTHAGEHACAGAIPTIMYRAVDALGKQSTHGDMWEVGMYICMHVCASLSLSVPPSPPTFVYLRMRTKSHNYACIFWCMIVCKSTHLNALHMLVE